MTAAEYNTSVDTAVAAQIKQAATAPPEPHLHLAFCVCGNDERPDVYRRYSYSEQHAIECSECGRHVGGPTKAATIALWNTPEDLLEACEEALEFVANQEDVVDGDYGIPAPNRAMRVATLLREAIKRAEKTEHP